MFDQSSLDRPHFVDRFHFHDGPRSDGGICALTWHPLPDRRLLVVAWERRDNPGQSVTNAAEAIRSCFLAETGVDPDRLVWVESYALDHPPLPAGSPAPRPRPEFDRCRFVQLAGGGVEPEWSPMTPTAWRELGIEPPTVPPITPLAGHPELDDEPEHVVPANIGDYHPPVRLPGSRGEIIYRGSRTVRGAVVSVTDDQGTRELHPRLDLRNHSPSGLEWGYGGSGPAQLALAILADMTGDDALSLQSYQDFKWDVVANLSADGFTLDLTQITHWMRG